MEQCNAEVWSWWYFNPDQVDAYWIQCTLSSPHPYTEFHKDENTGLEWKDQVPIPYPGSTS